MRPLSSGSRKASKALRLNSGNSSKNNTPWWARDISPGRGGEPPPTKATEVAVWCGLRTERRPQSDGEKRPTKLATAALSKHSVKPMGGSKLAKRCANMDLPLPGGPIIKTLWPPAAAICKARLAPAWPFTSAMSMPNGAGVGGLALIKGQSLRPAVSASGAKACTTSLRCCAPCTLMCGTQAASRALSMGKTKRKGLSWAANARPMAKAPRTGRKSPDKDNSPANSWPAMAAASTTPLAAKMPMAMGRSKRPESLGKSAGARLTVMRLLLGNDRPAFCMAHRTRSRASLTSVSARPTKVKLGSPFAK